jgi:hypothetical protein
MSGELEQLHQHVTLALRFIKSGKGQLTHNGRKCG